MTFSFSEKKMEWERQELGLIHDLDTGSAEKLSLRFEYIVN